MTDDRRGDGTVHPGILKTCVLGFLAGAGAGALILIGMQLVLGSPVAEPRTVLTVLGSVGMAGLAIAASGPGPLVEYVSGALAEPGAEAWREALAVTGAVLWEADAESGTILYVSPEAATLFGYPLKDWDAAVDPWEWLVDPYDLRRVHEARAHAAGGTEAVRHAFRARNSDGDPLWVHESVRVVTDCADGRSRLRGVLTDATAEQRCARAQRSAESVLEALVGTLPLGVAAVDGDGYVSLWNDAAARILGWKADEVLGRTVPCLRGASGYLLFGQVAGSADDPVRAGARRVRLERRDGVMIDVAAWSAQLAPELGGPGGALVVLYDLGDRREAEAELARMEERVAWLETELREAGEALALAAEDRDSMPRSA